jgi:hypothetical protein
MNKACISTYLSLIAGLLLTHVNTAQVATGASGIYGLRLINPSYSGKAINVRRACDNATLDIGFSCGALDIATLQTFSILDNTLTGVSTSSATAYSLRKLNCTYAGKAINVRRSSDNATQDIGFTTAGDLDTAALKLFIGANSGYVTTWYDQSGNARNATQATNANQPRIVNAGFIDRYNGLPSVFFNNTGAGGYSICLQTANLNIYTSAACFLGVSAVNTDLTYNCLVVKTNSNNFPSPFDFYYNTGGATTTLLTGNGASANFFTCSKNFNPAAGMNIWTYQANGTNASGVNAYYDASTQIITNQTASFFGDNSSPVCIGARSDGVTGLNGWISEVLTFTSIPAAADIGFLEYTEGTYYGIAGPTYVAPSSAVNLDAYITTWYDQSGNGNNATQATAANQPLIVSNGVVNLQGTLPSINFNGTSNSLSANAFTTAFNNTGGGGGTLNTMAVNNGAASWQGMAQQGKASGTWWGIWGNNAGKWTGSFSGAVGNLVSAINSSVFEPITIIQLPATSTTLYGNGTQLLTTATVANLSNASAFNIGLGAAGEYWHGNGSEINIFSTGLNTTRRTLLETNQGAYYGFTPTNSKFTPANGYNLFVNGIGETSAADLVSSTTQSTGMGFVNVSFLGVGNYMTSGMTCPTAGVTTSLNMPIGATGTYERWTNDWLVNISNPAATAGNIQIYFDFSDYGVAAYGSPANASNYQLWGRANPAANFSTITTTGVPTIAGNRITFTLPVSNLTSGWYYTLGTLDYINSPLPVELLFFHASPAHNAVDLNWATLTETNNNYFTIERSADAREFEWVGKVNGAGNSSEQLNYKLKDINPLPGLSYYRLKQTDFNGKTTIYDPVSVTFSSNAYFTVYPNPSHGNDLAIKMGNTFQGKEVLVVLYDMNGRQIYSKLIVSDKSEGPLQAIELEDKLAPGVYLIIASSDNDIYKQKIIIQ